MRWLPGTRILTWVEDTVDQAAYRASSVPLSPAASPCAARRARAGEGAGPSSGVVAHVEHQPVAPLGEALGAGDPLGGGEHLGQDVAVLGGDVGGVADVLARHDEHVHGRGGVDVAEGVGALGRGHLVGGDLARHDPAEEAVVHQLLSKLARHPFSEAGCVATLRATDDLDDLDHLGDLDAWVAVAKADEAAAARVRERWLRQQAGEQTRFALVVRRRRRPRPDGAGADRRRRPFRAHRRHRARLRVDRDRARPPGDRGARRHRHAGGARRHPARGGARPRRRGRRPRGTRVARRPPGRCRRRPPPRRGPHPRGRSA